MPTRALVSEQHVVVVSRKWDHPEILVDVTDRGLRLTIGLEAFVLALAREVGSPRWVWTVGELERRLQAAAERVVSGVKQETTRVM